MKKSVLANIQLKCYLINFSSYMFVEWMSVGALPILIASEYGAGSAFILTFAFTVLPRILFAPFIAIAIKKFHIEKILMFSILLLSILNLILPFIYNYRYFQIIVFLTGIINVAIIPSLQSLRSQVIPENQNVFINTICQVVSILARIIGPGFVAILTIMSGIKVCYYSISILFFLIFLNLGFQYLKYPIKDISYQNKKISLIKEKLYLKELTKLFIKDIFNIFYRNPVLLIVVIPALGYSVTLGALKPFFFWSNTETFNNSDDKWVYFLIVQGLGAIVSGWIISHFANLLEKSHSILYFYLYTCLLEGLAHLSLIWANNYYLALFIVFIGGIPEMLAYVLYFTIIQKKVIPSDESTLYSLTMPFFDCAMFFGILLGRIYTDKIVSLQIFWLIATSISIITILPLFGLLQRNIIKEHY